MFRYLVTIMALIIFPATLSHVLQFRTIADMDAVRLLSPVPSATYAL